MICEPNLNLPQPIELESLKMTTETNKVELGKTSLDQTNVKREVLYEQKDYDLLPLFKDQFQHLNNILSLHSNDYLACRWNTFLDNVPQNYIRIRSYVDYKKSLETQVVRRKLLNGHFYGIDNKLAPIPQLKDPRSFAKIDNQKK
ncbi:hypothetical protein FF38_06784 [Lucilia cuprina]|uniref:Uncharacterized protein n=1 Tax=Lucilia cuprina TaxID=7375 RepID=A0A0L0CLE3_LUCCU|nr:hypothetical protein CVS40_10586 [Lucilia cuprina]KNC33188.1 hypothetical protein FF38_06784 [Lucilia cuprina]